MQNITFFLIAVFLIQFNSAQKKISFTNEDGYIMPFPLFLNTTFKIRELIGIDENENSITIRVNLLSRWKDSGLKCSDPADQ